MTSHTELHDTYSEIEQVEIQNAFDKILRALQQLELTDQEVSLSYFKGATEDGADGKFFEISLLNNDSHWLTQVLFQSVEEEGDIFSEDVFGETWNEAAHNVIVWLDGLQKMFRERLPELEEWLQENNRAISLISE